MLKRIVLASILVGLVSTAMVACGGNSDPTPTPVQPASPPTPPPAPAAPPTAVVPPTPAPAAPPAASGPTSLTIDMPDGGGRGPFAFDPADLAFTVGETVSFTFTAESQFHTFTVDALGIDVAVDGGATVDFEFTFDEAGTYELICTPHLLLGMLGTITVQ